MVPIIGAAIAGGAAIANGAAALATGVASGAAALAAGAAAVVGGASGGAGTATTGALVGATLLKGIGALTSAASASLPVAVGTATAIAIGAVKLGCEEFKLVFNTLSKTFSEAIDNRIQHPVITYSEIIDYFVQAKESDSRIGKALLLKKNNEADGVCELYAICLGQNNEMLYDKNKSVVGRQYKCKNIDSDLAAMFDGQDVILFD